MGILLLLIGTSNGGWHSKFWKIIKNALPTSVCSDGPTYLLSLRTPTIRLIHMLCSRRSQEFCVKKLPTNLRSKIYRNIDLSRNRILFQKMFWPTVRKRCSSDWENFWNSRLKSENFAKVQRSLEQFIQTVKSQAIFWNVMLF